MSKKEVAIKRNLSSMQVIKTLQLLLEDNYTMTELVERLNKDEKEPVFNNSVVSKYINTCRYVGIDIPKIHNRYYVAQVPFGMNITAAELDLLEKLQYTASEKLTKNSIIHFANLMSRINKFSNKHIARVEKKTFKNTCELFERAVEEKRKVVLMFRAKALLECVPLKISESKNQFCRRGACEPCAQVRRRGTHLGRRPSLDPARAHSVPLHRQGSGRQVYRQG
jgi:hypothetical protein